MNIQVGKLKNVKLAETKINLSESVPTEAYGYGEVNLSRPIQFSGSIKNAGDMLELEGHASGMVELVCSRCLEPFDWPYDITITETYTNQEEFTSHDLEDEVITYMGDEIDIAPQILKQLFLELPMKAVCQEHCKGLCSHCGANLNQGQCSCGQEDIDLRLEKLKDLLQSLDKGV